MRGAYGQGDEAFASYGKTDTVDSRQVGEDLALQLRGKIDDAMRTAVEAFLFDIGGQIELCLPLAHKV